MCNDRAIRTVDGELLVEGKSITPERYLACWRVSIAHPLSPVQFAERFGRIPCAVLGGPLVRLRGRPKSWTSSPFERFDDFEDAYRDRIAYLDGGQRFRIELDLRQTHAARDAFYLESFVQAADAGADTFVSVVLKASSISRPQLAPSAAEQSELFASIPEAA